MYLLSSISLIHSFHNEIHIAWIYMEVFAVVNEINKEKQDVTTIEGII